MSTTFNDPVIINNTLDVDASGAKSASFTGVDLSNVATSTTAGVDKIAARIESTGTWSGTGARNYALKIQPATGGTKNWNLWSGDSASFTSFSQSLFGGSQNVFATKDGPNFLAPVLCLSESGTGEVIALNSIGVGTDGTTDCGSLWAEASNEGATLSPMAAISGILSGTDGSAEEAVCIWAAGTNVTPAEFTITNLYGVRVEPLEGATNNYAIQTNQSAASNSFAIYNAGAAKSYFGGDIGIGTASPASRLDIDNGAFTLAEMTAPSAPAANKCVMYAEDNGAGKTRLMVRFGSGSAIQLAIEP